jgi:hypothetical protein
MQLRDKKLLEYKNEFPDGMNLAAPTFFPNSIIIQINFQTELEGASRLFSVGRYRVEALVENGAARLKSVTVVADTGLIPSLLATPI